MENNYSNKMTDFRDGGPRSANLQTRKAPKSLALMFRGTRANVSTVPRREKVVTSERNINK